LAAERPATSFAQRFDVENFLFNLLHYFQLTTFTKAVFDGGLSAFMIPNFSKKNY
jgi:hypothetical protein